VAYPDVNDLAQLRQCGFSVANPHERRKEKFMSRFKLTIAVLAAFAASSAGCTENENQACNAQSSLIWSNGVQWSNGLSWSNGIHWSNGLLASALSDQSVDDHLAPGTLDEPETRKAFEYLVRCALGPDQLVHARVGGEPVTFAGKIGLARDWADGACGESCQRWVSACLLSSVNNKGESVAIVLDGAHPALQGDVEGAYPIPEASFYGNLFVEHPQIYACVHDGGPGLVRTCGDADGEGCFLQVTGRCEDVCSAAGCRGGDGTLVSQVIEVWRAEDACSR